MIGIFIISLISSASHETEPNVLKYKLIQEHDAVRILWLPLADRVKQSGFSIVSPLAVRIHGHEVAFSSCIGSPRVPVGVINAFTSRSPKPSAFCCCIRPRRPPLVAYSYERPKAPNDHQPRLERKPNYNYYLCILPKPNSRLLLSVRRPFRWTRDACSSNGSTHRNRCMFAVSPMLERREIRWF